jgi:hypothetical protein
MTWYKTGTVQVTLNSNAVVGTGTAFIANARVGDAFSGPDGNWYEVINVVSNTSLGIYPNYRGASVASGGVYVIAPMEGYVKDSADALRAASLVIGQFSSTKANSGANSDITSITGLTTPLSVTQGGTGGNTPAAGRTALGLGTVAVENTVPVAKGGTGATTAATARTNLGLGTAAMAAVGNSPGNVPDAQRIGYSSGSVTTDFWGSLQGQGFDNTTYLNPTNGPTGGTGIWYKQTILYAGTDNNRLMIAWPYSTPGNTGTIKMRGSYSGSLTPEIELFHTGNAIQDPSTTVGLMSSTVVNGYTISKFANGIAHVIGVISNTIPSTAAAARAEFTVVIPSIFIGASSVGATLTAFPAATNDYYTPVCTPTSPTNVFCSIRNGATAQSFSSAVLSVWGRWK